MNHAFLAFCAPGDHLGVCAAVSGAGLSVADIFFAERKTPPVPTHLLAIGPDGGAALARWVAEHGLDGVAGIGLVGVTAPWAERCLLGLPDEIYQDGPDYEGEVWPPMPEYSRLPLGPLEPLRAVAERARKGESCNECNGRGDVRIPGSHSASLSDHEYGDPRCGGCAATGRVFRPRLVVACAPDDGVCAWCNGRAIVSINALWGGGGRRDVICHACTNGRALSSSDVARELISDADGQFGAHGDPLESYEWVSGGAIVICYERRAALDEHGLRAVVERLVR